MTNLLKMDLKRIFKDKLLIIVGILGVVFATILPLSYYFLYNSADQSAAVLATFDLMGMSFTAKYLFFSAFGPSSNFGLALPILLAIIVYKEFSHGTICNKLIYGSSRKSVFLSMFSANAIALCSIMLCYSLLIMLISLCFFPFQSQPFTLEDLGFFLQAISFELLVYIFIAALMSFLLVFMKNIGGAIVLYAGGTLFSTLIASLAATGTLVFQYIPGKESVVSFLQFLTDTNIIYKSTTAGDIANFTDVTILRMFLTAIIGILVFVGLGLLVFRKKDIK